VSHRVPRVLALLLAPAVFVAACSSGGSGTTAPTTSSSDTVGLSTTTAGASTTTTVAADPTLEVLLLQTVPSALVKQPDQISDSGPTNLAKAVRDEASAGGAQLLSQAGFVSGYQRVWASGDSVRQNTIFLYRFKTPQGAAEYATNRASELNAFGSNAPIASFNVPMPGGVGLHSESSTLSFGAVVFSKGNYSVQAVSTDGAQADQSVAVVALAQAQFDRLP
jgi:hypothetical protein